MRTTATAILVLIASTVCAAGGIVLPFKLRREPCTLAAAFERFDVPHYKDIVDFGYSYNAEARSLVAFFPVLPFTARIIQSATNAPTTAALLVASNIYLFGAYIAFAHYLKDRFPDGEARAAKSSVFFTTLGIFAFFPTTFFFHIPYSESAFVCFGTLTFLGISRRWPLWAIAAAIGCATASRSVGVALLFPFVVHVANTANSRRQALVQTATLLPIACSGLMAYMIFNYCEFGDALAFAKTQSHWRIRGYVPGWEKWLSLAAFEPFWAVFVKNSPYHWLQNDWSIFSLNFMNPIYFGGTAVLIALGAWKRWLTREEIAVSVPLLLIPYVTRGFEWGLMSHARFAAVVFPAYIVMGHLLAKLPPPVAMACIGLSAFLMGAYAALFAAGHGFY